MSQIAEYIWLDGHGRVRSKTRVLDSDIIPDWNYDGSSTYQKFVSDSEVMLYPVKSFPDPLRGESNILVLCETDYEKCTRRIARDIFEQHPELEPMFGLEQEFFIYDKSTNLPVGWMADSAPEPQGDYYCAVGADVCQSRAYMECVLGYALAAGIKLTGFNWEVAPGQAEFQVCAIGIDAADHLIILRYLLMRIGEDFNLYVSFDNKPFTNWNGSGLHTNFSTKEMRENDNGIDMIHTAINKLALTHHDDLKLFGENNHRRLSGKYETSSAAKFTYGAASRNTSIRIPTSTTKDKKGYFEDRRPGANANPYIITANMFKVVCGDDESLPE